MGRPINKRFIGVGDGKIQPTRYAFTGSLTTTSSDVQAWIVSQRSTNTFVVSDGTTTETLTLVNKTSLSQGEFNIDAVLDDSSIVQVTRLYNRKVQYEGGTVDVDRVKYTIGAPGNVDDSISGTATVDGQPGSSPADIVQV